MAEEERDVFGHEDVAVDVELVALHHSTNGSSRDPEERAKGLFGVQGFSLPRKMAHLSHDEAVLKMGHPVLWLESGLIPPRCENAFSI